MNLPFLQPSPDHASSTGELLLTRGLSKSFSHSPSLGRTLAQHALRLKNPHGKFTVFEEVDFTLFRGECVALLGPNGCGKSTFLRCLGGVIFPTSGEVLRLGRTVALLTHGFGAYEELAVWRNIVLVLQLFGRSHSTAMERLPEVAEMAGLSDRLLSNTSQLSEGMLAKISLAALAFSSFDVALLDESLNHVDSDFRHRFFELTRKWISEGRSLVLTSHDEALPERFATRSLRIENKRLVAAR